MNENCKYKCIVELCPYVLCLRQNFPVICPKYKVCKVYNSIEYNTDTSAGHPVKDDDIVRYSLETRRVKDKEP
mgnify:FL=1|jgi:hypothetical protein